MSSAACIRLLCLGFGFATRSSLRFSSETGSEAMSSHTYLGTLSYTFSGDDPTGGESFAEAVATAEDMFAAGGEGSTLQFPPIPSLAFGQSFSFHFDVTSTQCLDSSSPLGSGLAGSPSVKSRMILFVAV